MSVAKRKLLKQIRQIIPRSKYIAEAAVPELSFHPDLMADLETNLTFFQIATLNDQKECDWKTLRLIEYLFEVKLFFGNKTCFHLILPSIENWKQYCLELLDNFFDRVSYQANMRTFNDLYTRPKEENFDLWDLEREYEKDRPPFVNEEILRSFKHRDVPSSELLQEVLYGLQRNGKQVYRNFSVFNLKNYYLSENMNLHFFFDFLVDRTIVEVVSFETLNPLTLQNLLIKARLIRYHKVGNRIERVDPMHASFNKMLLLVNGKIDGPYYDKLRFLRMLNSAGWDVFSANMGIARLREVLQ